jgi:hypothetical protein
VERPSPNDRPLIVERRSLRSALRAPVETTKELALPAIQGKQVVDAMQLLRRHRHQRHDEPI